MKNILKYINLLLVILLLASCEDYLDINTDPNNPTVVSPDLVLPVAQKYTGEVMQCSDEGARRVNSLANMMMYNWSQADGYNWYPDEFKYLVTADFYDRIFEQTYYDALKQYQVLEGLAPEYNYYKAIAKIMKSFHFQVLVDLYGDIPYFEALLRGKNATPVYDDAQTIYEDLIVQLTEAIDLIDNAENPEEVGDDDAMFGGNMDEWKAFANTVKLRILTRQMSMSGRAAYIQAEFDVIAAEGSGYITDDVGVNPGYLQEEGKQNPFYNLYGWDAGGTQTLSSKATCATDYIITYLEGTNDDRIDYIYEEPATGHLGVVQGLLAYDTPTPGWAVPELVSNLGTGVLKDPDQDVVIYSLAECYFNLAEAALPANGYVAGAAQTYYESGIQASFDYLGAPGASAYYGQGLPNVGWVASSSNELEAIITQKWIATNSITAEQSWFDYSRTGYPSGLPISLLASTPDRPVRIYYPASEISSNGANVPTQPDAFTAKIFWGN
ncbi:MAG: SusD/RagB family nutrient-binding outer membrane lipoprotein [Bacteroidales bacterium]|nr:SusD/RagB family nutrient-binding outer membrane lipoprotein [Bacteroidales bacterium]